ncbi:MAG: CHAT domain-containing protein [Candidatus Afipia apatlaquensis]|uniref:CHAT domain-containing protein n=1 Tax=Candidatus Afipia apatlaquensis TaxID=2712852 RepID=A0A7C9VRA9_9BRAD|nr:CHAT domain-containing protein [Candidatus Afipia apatlaquensis]
MMTAAKSGAAAFLVSLLLLGISSGAFAFNKEAALEQCRASVGRPTYQACKRSGGDHETCFAKARAVVQPCFKAKLPTAALFDANKVSAPDAKEAAETAKEVAKLAPQSLVAPPRSISDITAILDQQKPDEAKIAELKKAADAPVPSNLSGTDLANFHYKRAQARVLLGRSDALADAEAAVTHGKNSDYKNEGSRYENLLSRRLRDAGESKRANAIITKQIAAFSNQTKGKLFGLYYNQTLTAIRNGDVSLAESYVARSRALLNESRKWQVYNIYGTSYQAFVEDGSARVEEARGRYKQAEDAYHKASAFYTATLKYFPQWESTPADGEFERYADWSLAFEGRVKVKQGRVGEGEADVRRALLSRLSKSGKFHADTAGVLGVLVYVIQEQGRYADAEKLQREVVDIYQGLGYAPESVPLVNSNIFLAQILNLAKKSDEASKLFDQIDGWTAKWDPTRREMANGGLARVSLLLGQNKNPEALEAAQRAFDREMKSSGDKSFNTAIARGYLAAALARNGKANEALAAFKDSLPVVLNISGGSDDDAGSTAAARENRVRFVVEGYIRTLALNPSVAPPNIADETFGLADVLRGQSVQRALQASSVRSAAKNPELAALVRTSQDTDKRIGAAVATLNNLLALSPTERDDKTVKITQAEIASLQATKAQALKDIARKFPDYGNLTNPPPPNATELQKTLSDDEALLSFYFGQYDSFVWVVRKDAPVQFARIRMTLGDLNATVTKLREALEPQAAMISDIPAFDVKRASELYDQLLRPLESSWKPAKSLIVVTNGALGLLPLSLLPTAAAEVKADDDPLFASYRNVPWLARTHAVTLVPSAAALQTLRKLPPGKATRQDLVAFGDPYFNKEQADAAAQPENPVQVADASIVTRGVPLKRRNSPQLDGVNSAQLGLLPRLPDTSEELKSIALALQADPTKVLNLGKEANEKKVKSMDLSGFKIVAFATHGLVPGELDGLTQPALALSAPALSESDGDGLLTMEEILSLKLDADWVVLSACNTAAGAGAGAEAASGLGRAFFYAGTRALLVTNWSVHSQSARELVTDLFKRQADDPKLTRGEALRRAMMALADGPGYLGTDGKTEFAYAHPLFWAPYSIIGDGGGR